MITAEVNLGNDYHTQVVGETINEIIEKIKDYHTMSDFEKKCIMEKDGSLDEALASGWYITE